MRRRLSNGQGFPSVSQSGERLLSKLGFRYGANGAHSSRTMMLADITTLLDTAVPDADRAALVREVVEGNCLGKPSKRARLLALRHLAQLYGLDPSLAVYRAFRKLWSTDTIGRPLLALLVALARDPILRVTRDSVLALQPGETTNRERLEQQLRGICANRFSPASLRSLAQNINGTWTDAGVLDGRVNKQRTTPVVSAEAVTLALFLGYLEGGSGQRLFSTEWAQALAIAPDQLDALAVSAHQRGHLVYLSGGGVHEFRFPGYLTADEIQWREELAHVEGR